MNEISAFRGASGEVVRGFVRPATLGTCFPVIVCTLVLSVFAGLIVGWMKLPNWLSIPVSTITTAPVIGLFAMAARAGALNCGFFEALTQHLGRVPGFVLRFSALAVPFGALAGLSIEQMGSSFGSMAMGGGSSLTSSILWLGLFLLGGVIGPSLGLLVAVRTDTVGEAISPDAWGWILGERRGDLPAYFASAIGGLLLFWMLALPAIGLLGAMAMSVAPQAGLMLAGVAWVAPLAASPILLGRLAGAFACGDFMEAGELGAQPARPQGQAPRPQPSAPSRPPRAQAPGPAPAASAPTAAPAPAAPAPAPAPAATTAPAPPRAPITPTAGAAVLGAVSAAGTSLERKTPPALAVKELDARAETDLGGALRDAQQLAEACPRSAPALVLHARLAKRAGLADEAREAAGRAVPVCFETGAGALAVELFLEFSAEANHLGLDGTAWLSLGKALGARHHGAAAHWCLRAAAATHADASLVDKARISLAENSLAAGRSAEALQVYETLLAERPDSAFADFARDGATLARKKLPEGVS